MTSTPRSRSRFVDAAILEYAVAHSTGPDDIQLELQQVTADKTGGFSQMQIGSDQALFMELLVRAMGVHAAIEIGTFTGYSALAVARALPPGGSLLCLDISEEWTSIGKPYWERAGVADRIELRLGPALETLRTLPREEQFDFAFVDADKRGYPDYYEELLPRLRPGSLLLADNTLRDGNVLSAEPDDDTKAMKAFNDALAGDERVRVLMMPIGDGVTIAQKVSRSSS